MVPLGERATRLLTRVYVQSVIIVEDAPSSLLGVQSANKTKSGVSSDLENMIKAFLTSMQANLLTLEMDPTRKGVTVKADCSCVCFFAMNETTGVFADAMLQRFYVSIWNQQEPQSESESMVATAARQDAPVVKEAFDKMKIYWNRTQVLVAEILYRMSVGILQDVTFDAAIIFFSLVGVHAKKTRNVSMEDRRKFIRFLNIVRELVVIDVVDLFYDSPLSPIEDEPHHERHFLLTEKLYVATKQHAIFALGQLGDQWQDNLRARCISTMQQIWFRDAKDKARANKTPIPESEVVDDEPGSGQQQEQKDAPDMPDGFPHWLLSKSPLKYTTKDKEVLDKDPSFREYLARRQEYTGVMQQKKNWMYSDVRMGSQALPAATATRGMVASQGDVIHHLANQLVRHLHPKPLLAEVEAVLYRLLQENGDEMRVVEQMPGVTYHQVKAGVPVLTIDGDTIRLSVSAIENAERSDVIFESCQEVLTDLFNCGADEGAGAGATTSTYLYGDTEPSNPHVWRMVVAQKRPRAAGSDPARIHSAEYFDDAMQAQTMDFIRQIQPESGDQMKLFKANTPWKVIDMDIDKKAALVRAIGMGLSAEDQMASPSNVAQDTDTKLFVHWHNHHTTNGETMPVYPECYPSRDKVLTKEKFSKRYRTNPQDFSMRAEYDSMLKLQSGFKRKEGTGVRDELMEMPDLDRDDTTPMERGFHQRAQERAVNRPAAAAAAQSPTQADMDEAMEAMRMEEGY